MTKLTKNDDTPRRATVSENTGGNTGDVIWWFGDFCILLRWSILEVHVKVKKTQIELLLL